MLMPCLERFNKSLAAFQVKYPKQDWTDSFRNSLINDFTSFSSRIEDSSVDYGDTIRFFNDEFVNKEKLTSFLQLNDHRNVLAGLIDLYQDFELTEETVKNVHGQLMGNYLSWSGDFKPELVGNYRNFPVVGNREPFHRDKEYVAHYNLEFSMASHMELFARKFDAIDNSADTTHLLMALAYFHNKFLNLIHPFADGNGRVCRILMGIVMMKNGCPPIFSRITTEQDMIDYINVIIACEQQDSDVPLIEYMAEGMAGYLEAR